MTLSAELETEQPALLGTQPTAFGTPGGVVPDDDDTVGVGGEVLVDHSRHGPTEVMAVISVWAPGVIVDDGSRSFTDGHAADVTSELAIL